MPPKQRESHRKKRVIECAEFEFLSLLEKIKADMAGQLERVWEAERGGSWKRLPAKKGHRGMA